MSSATMAIDFQAIAAKLTESKAFEEVTVTDQSVSAQAAEVEENAYYRVVFEDGKLFAGLYIEDRWLSESIESDLLHCGDKIEELLEEEMVELDLDFQLPMQHFRNEKLEYVFRSEIAEVDQQTTETLTTILLSYNACFEQLGDMGPEEDPFA